MAEQPSVLVEGRTLAPDAWRLGATGECRFRDFDGSNYKPANAAFDTADHRRLPDQRAINN